MVLRKLPHNAEVFFHLGLFYIRQNQIKKSKEAFDKALECLSQRESISLKHKSEQEKSLAARIHNHLASVILFNQEKEQEHEQHLEMLSKVQKMYITATEVSKCVYCLTVVA